jgi:hypothetical protein
MSLDYKYIPLGDLQVLMVDKDGINPDSSLPLTSGKVYFYKDSARSELKSAYTLSGSPSNYTYVPLPNPCILSSVGTFVDDTGNDIVPYLRPYADDDSTIVELYYIVVTNSDDVFQFSRSAVPYLPDQGADPIDNTVQPINYISNGQFEIINADMRRDVRYFFSEGSYNIDGDYLFYINGSPNVRRYGDIFFSRNNNDDTDTFSINSFAANPLPGVISGNARYYFQYNAEWTLWWSDAWKDLVFVRGNVKLFAGNEIIVGLQGYSYYGGSSSRIRVYCLQHFGGAVPDVVTYCTNPASQGLNNAFSTYHFRFVVPALGASIINENDNYFAIGISFPLNTSCSISITNIEIKLGHDVSVYTQQPDDYVTALDTGNKIPDLPPSSSKQDDENTIPLGIVGRYGNVPLLDYDLYRSNTPYVNWGQADPTGFIKEWPWPLESLPRGYKPFDGRTISAYKFNELYKLASGNRTTDPIYGYGCSTIAAARSGTNIVDVANATIGVCAPPVITAYAFSIIDIVPGTPASPLTYSIVCPSGANIYYTDSIRIDTLGPNNTSATFFIRFIIDGLLYPTITSDNLFNDNDIYVYINSNFTNLQVAKVISNVLNPLGFLLPDWRAMTLRGVNGTRSDSFADPDSNSRLDRGDGTVGNVVGTMQQNTSISHNHIINQGKGTTHAGPLKTIFDIINTNSSAPSNVDISSGYELVTTDYVGSSESRSNNAYVYLVVKT